jgi:predicted permease
MPLFEHLSARKTRSWTYRPSASPASLLRGIAYDCTFVLRSLRRSPVFAITVILTLALGIGANAAVFSVVDRLFLSVPSGVIKPANVWRLAVDARQTSASNVATLATIWNYPSYRALVDAMPAGTRSAAYHTWANKPIGDARSGRAAVVTYVVDDYFGVLGVAPVRGRFFQDLEPTTRALAPFAVISWRMWKSDYASANDVLERTLLVGGRPYRIIGVAPEAFHGVDLEQVDVWVPRSTMISWEDWSPAGVESSRMTDLQIVSRLPSGVMPSAAEALGTQVVRDQGIRADSAAQLHLRPLERAAIVGTDAAGADVSGRLAIAALVILLVACTNVANLLIARAVERRREIGTRLALGASRARLISQLFMEAFALAAAGGIAAAICATWLAQALGRTLLPSVRWDVPVLGFRLIAFIAFTVVIASMAAGIVPALQASQPDLTHALGGGAGPRDRSRWRAALLLAQVSLSTILLVVGGLFVRTLGNVEAIDLGFSADGLVAADVVPNMSFSHKDMETFRQIGAVLPAAAARIAKLPGVERVALADRGLMAGFDAYRIFVPGRDSIPRSNSMPPLTHIVSPEYFATTGQRILDGRPITADDRRGAELITVVDASMAHAFWPGQRAVGQCVIIATHDAPCRTVVGVVADAHYLRIMERGAMQLYVPLAQADSTASAETILIRTKQGYGSSVVMEARSIIGPMVDQWGAAQLRTADEILAPELRPWRVVAVLYSGAAILALIVAAVGIYGTIAYSVTQQTREFGIRIALGAHRSDILALVLGGGMRLVGIGVAAGVIISAFLGKLIASMLYGTSTHDPIVLVSVASSILVVAAIASLTPALRATRVDPAESLRAE